MFMKNLLVLLILINPASCSYDCKDRKCLKGNSPATSTQEGVMAKNGDSALQCKLTSEELRSRKETVLASLKKKIISKKELTNGYAFKFDGSDATFIELSDFIKSERACCNFFVFTLSVGGDGKETWLSLTGPEGAKEMISQELGL